MLRVKDQRSFSFEVGSDLHKPNETPKKTCMQRDSYLPGITKWDPFWGSQTWCKSMVVLRDFSLNGALFGLDIFILTLVIHCCWCFIPPPFSTFFLCENINNTNNTCWIRCQSQLVLSTAGSQQILTKFQLGFGCVFVVQLFTNSVFIFFDLQVQNSTKYVLTLLNEVVWFCSQMVGI